MGAFPCNQKVYVRTEELGDVTEGGIVIPNEAKVNQKYNAAVGWLEKLGPAAELAVYIKGEKIFLTPEMLPLKVIHAKYGGVGVDERPVVGGDEINKSGRVMLDDDIITVLIPDEDKFLELYKGE